MPKVEAKERRAVALLVMEQKEVAVEGPLVFAAEAWQTGLQTQPAVVVARQDGGSESALWPCQLLQLPWGKRGMIQSPSRASCTWSSVRKLMMM